MKLYAISDIHISHSANLEAFARLRPHPDDWLLLGGDIGETEEDLRTCLRITTERFARVFWVPGNHELWRVPEHSPGGVARYERLLALCREFGVTTPEDEYNPVAWTGPTLPDRTTVSTVRL